MLWGDPHTAIVEKRAAIDYQTVYGVKRHGWGIERQYHECDIRNHWNRAFYRGH